MADPQTVIEGSLKYRDNKKWKPRWCVIRKLSPVADCLHLQLYRDSKDRCKNGPTKASLSLEGFMGLETGFTLDKESNTMALICTEVVVVLAFDSRELLIQWQVKVRANLLEEHQFLVQIAYVPSKSKLASGPARLHLLDYMFCLTAGVPPKLLGIWPLRELRRFGVVDGKFCFEGGSRCGKGEGLHVLLTNQAKDLVQAFDMASRGRLPGKRKVSVRKNTSGVDGVPRTSMSGSRPCSGAEPDKLDTCSSESSTKPLLSSGSDDGKGARPCHFHYRWPSCIVPCGTAPNEEGSKTLARSTVNRTTDGQMMWAVGHCQGCGVHYCRRGEKENEDGSGFTPQWTMDLGIVSPSADVQTRTCTRPRTKPHDRSSLCSQSSQSSGTSTASSSSNSSNLSEYSVPKNCLEAFYDRPKNVHHPNTAGIPYNRLSLSEDKDRLLPIREGPCSCWKQQPQKAEHELLLFGGGLVCSCWTRGPETDMPSMSSSGSSNASPSTSPKKQMPFMSVPILLPCTCGKTVNNPYLNYAVPRSGAPVKGIKDEKAEVVTVTGTHQESKIINKVDNSSTKCVVSDEKESNGNLIGSSTIPKSSHPGQVCSCQRLLLCPGSLLPSFNTISSMDCGRKGRLNCSTSEYATVNPKCVPADLRPEHNLNCRCRQPPECNCGRAAMLNRFGRKDNANHIYVNLKYLQETAMTGVVPGKLIPYYANLHFLQTLSLYENAEILDVRPADASGNDASVPKRPNKKRIETPSSSEVYEMMSFNQPGLQPSSSGNYLLMQPGTVESQELSAEDSISVLSQSMTSTSSSEGLPDSSETILPLRPFMPVLLPFHEHTCDGKDMVECKESMASTAMEHLRSNSLGDIKFPTSRRYRSSSTDGRAEASEECPSPRSATPRKHPLLTKLSLKSKEKSFSTDEITPPSSAPSSPDSLFLENIQKYPFHRSADCLQLHEEYRLSEEDLSQDPEALMSQSMEKRSTSSIKRSSSVPCKSNPNSQQQHSASSTDSGISTHLPTTLGGQGAVFSHFIAYHGSLPRRHSGNAANRHPVMDKKFSTGNKPSSQEQKQATDQSKMILISECKQCHQYVTSPDGVIVLDAKSMTSSSSSDMSDYIESLSLCSRSSSGSSDVRCGDDFVKVPTSCTRPRSGKEYHSFDRGVCPYIPIAQVNTAADDVEMTNNNINNNNNKTSSPGYISCSPANTEFTDLCFLSSPEKTSQFAFPPKESTKELNYLEVVSVGESESSSVKQQSSVQYAVIDMVATNAARKLSTERAQLRNEGPNEDTDAK